MQLDMRATIIAPTNQYRHNTYVVASRNTLGAILHIPENEDYPFQMFRYEELHLHHPQPGDVIRVTFESTVDRHGTWLGADSSQHRNMRWEIVEFADDTLPVCDRCHITILGEGRQHESCEITKTDGTKVHVHEDEQNCYRNIHASNVGLPVSYLTDTERAVHDANSRNES